MDGMMGDPRRLPVYAGRPATAATATGSHRAHIQEQARVVREALGG